MDISRRRFFAASAVAAGAAVLPAAAADEPKREINRQTAAALKLSSQYGFIPGRDLAEKLATMEKWGFDAVELYGDAVGNEKKFADAIKKTRLKVSAICWGSHNGNVVSDVAAKRPAALDALRRALDCAGELGSTGVIYIPAFNGQTKLPNPEIRKILVDTLPAIGEHAVKAGSRVLLEPLNRSEAYFLRQVADAAAIARDCKSPGIAVMGDFFHMFIEETSDMGAFISGGSRVHHVHLASRTRVLPGQDDRQFIDGFRGLKWIGYQDYCSLECGVRGKPEEEIPKSMAFLRQQWSQA